MSPLRPSGSQISTARRTTSDRVVGAGSVGIGFLRRDVRRRVVVVERLLRRRVLVRLEVRVRVERRDVGKDHVVVIGRVGRLRVAERRLAVPHLA